MDIDKWRKSPHLKYDGYLLSKFPILLQNLDKHMERIRDFEPRESDLLICSYPKSGMNWIYEITGMLRQGDATYMQDYKGFTNLEATDINNLDFLDSPRILSTHLPVRHLPTKYIEDGHKILRILRNPKDVMVSLYNHVKRDMTSSTDDFPGTWEEFLMDQCSNTHNLYDGWFNYEKGWETAVRSGTITNIHCVYYEDMHKDPVGQIKELSAFLGVSCSEELIQQIISKCSFKKLSYDGANEKSGSEILVKHSLDGTNFLFRKGIVGDWKNWFTVTQNEIFDGVYAREMNNSTLQFKYSL